MWLTILQQPNDNAVSDKVESGTIRKSSVKQNANDRKERLRYFVKKMWNDSMKHKINYKISLCIGS